MGTREAWRESLPWIIGSSESLAWLVWPVALLSGCVVGRVVTSLHLPVSPPLPPTPPALALNLLIFPFAAAYLVRLFNADKDANVQLPTAAVAAALAMLFKYMTVRV